MVDTDKELKTLIDQVQKDIEDNLKPYLGKLNTNQIEQFSSYLKNKCFKDRDDIIIVVEPNQIVKIIQKQ
jgi:ubiquinone biosynthesis protein UbiJ